MYTLRLLACCKIESIFVNNNLNKKICTYEFCNNYYFLNFKIIGGRMNIFYRKHDYNLSIAC